MNKDLQRRWRFFRENAGGCVGWNAAGALELARAELWRIDQEDSGRMRVVWEYDPFQEWDGDCPRPEEILICALQERDCGCDGPSYPGAEYGEHCPHWRTVACLGGIGDPDASYRRVVEAELTSERWREVTEKEVGAVLTI